MEGLTLKDVQAKQQNAGDSAVEAFRRDLQKIRSGRASSGLVEGILVEYYGAKTALVHLGQITTPEPQLIVVQVYDSGAASAVEKAVQSSGLGFNPSREGNVIRISVQPLNEERRRDLVKVLHKMAEEMRISLRNQRREANEHIKALEKDGDVAKDEAKKAMDLIQKKTDGFVSQIDALLKAKEAECLEV